MAGALIFALDVATHTGFAIGRIGEKPRFGSWRLKRPDDDPEKAFGNLLCHVRDLIIVEGTPDYYIYEAPINAGALRQEAVTYKDGRADTVKAVRRTNAKTTYLLIGAAAVACAAPFAWGVTAEKISVQTVRKSFLGHGFPPDPKEAVMAQCRLMGFDVKNDNEADALAIWHHKAGQATIWEKVAAAERRALNVGGS